MVAYEDARRRLHFSPNELVRKIAPTEPNDACADSVVCLFAWFLVCLFARYEAADEMNASDHKPVRPLCPK